MLALILCGIGGIIVGLAIGAYLVLHFSASILQAFWEGWGR